ncbi:hypothetical protein [Aliidiomarina soli]|uniref:Lipoprotein n=1 Tax=Aliidiomarina soli TaxID=1928574 RepID=A0A432WD08_9GAMM|nr:hypothetical protein [Aliidiomarina soli]RUO30292.1 hypothetical protein CWE14_13035 [Aliidiomarina soli]
MKKVVLAASAVLLAFSVAACSGNSSPEDQMLQEMESFVADVEALTERESVCLSEMEAVFTDGSEKFMALAQELELSDSDELSEEQQARLEAFEQRMMEAGIELQQKADYNC